MTSRVRWVVCNAEISTVTCHAHSLQMPWALLRPAICTPTLSRGLFFWASGAWHPQTQTLPLGECLPGAKLQVHCLAPR